MNATTLPYLWGIIKGAGRQHHLLVQGKLAQIGRNLGYTSIMNTKLKVLPFIGITLQGLGKKCFSCGEVAT
jgi:hypothetical protein